MRIAKTRETYYTENSDRLVRGDAEKMIRDWEFLSVRYRENCNFRIRTFLSVSDEKFALFVRKLADGNGPWRVTHAISTIVDFDRYTTKTGFDVNTLTDIPSFRHEQDLNPGGSRMEIYETISHVSTNQVWLHINSASSRVYFRPIALFSFVARRARANLPEVTCLGSLSPLPSSPFIYNRSLLPCYTTLAFSLSLFTLRLVCTL